MPRFSCLAERKRNWRSFHGKNNKLQRLNPS
jgi:hypothetical protein